MFGHFCKGLEMLSFSIMKPLFNFTNVNVFTIPTTHFVNADFRLFGGNLKNLYKHAQSRTDYACKTSCTRLRDC